MRPLLCALAFFLIFSSLVSASQVWRVATSGQITTKPVVFSSGVAVATSAGEVFLLNPATGGVTWKAAVGGVPLQPVLSQNKLVVATTDGRVVLLGTTGEAEKQFYLSATQNVTYIYGMDATASKIFLTTNKGVFAIGSSGNASNIYPSSALTGAPSASGSTIVFSEGVNLVKANEAGAVEWKRPFGGAWNSKPTIEGQSVYVGGLDNRMHALAFTGGIERWSLDTGNWILSTPLVKDGVVYFGGNDGNVYALDQTDGSVLWKAKTPLAVETRPEPGTMGGEDVIFVGSTANGIYAIRAQTGDVIWMGTVEGWVADPLFYQDHVIFGSADKGIYSYSTERACSITSPVEGETIGYKELKITGNSVSVAGSPTVLVRVNEGDWRSANVSPDGSWHYYLNPASSMASGLNTISCMVSDSGGQESGKFTEIAVTRDPTAALSDFVPATSGTGLEGDVLTIQAYDAVDGSPVERFTATVDGKDYFAGGESVNVTIPSAGTHTLVIKKIGYNDLSMTFSIGSKGTSPLVLGAGALVLLVAVWLLFTKVLGKKK
jgi:outer membrane protein assembly factor BamB